MMNVLLKIFNLISFFYKNGVVLTSVFIITLSLTPYYAHAQEPKSKNQSQKWLTRSKLLTDSIIAEKSKISEDSLILIQAKLALLWRKTDKTLSDEWFSKAVDTLTKLNSDETEESKARRFRVAGNLLKIIPADNLLLQQKIIKFLVAEAEKNNNISNKEVADVIAQTALNVLNDNPEQAFNLGILSMQLDTDAPQFGKTDNIIKLLTQLALKKQSLGDKLFLRGLFYSLRNNDSISTISLVSLAFISLEGKILSDKIHKDLLSALTNSLVKLTQDLSNKKDVCQMADWGLSLKQHFEKYLPEGLSTFQILSNQCQQETNKNESNSSSSNNIIPKAVDDLLREAAESKDEAKYSQAFNILAQKKDFDRIISVLDNMAEEDRKILGFIGDIPSWSYYRWKYAYQLALLQIRLNNFSDANRVIEKTPKSLQPIVQVKIADTIISQRDNKLLATDLMESARKNMLRVEFANLRVDLYVLLLNHYASIQPYEALTIFRETVKVINLADYVQENEKESELVEIDMSKAIEVPVTLLETNEIDFMNNLADVKSPNSRIQIKLGLLKSSLQTYINEKSKVEKDRKSSEKETSLQ